MRQEFLAKLFIAQNSYKEITEILTNNQTAIFPRWIKEQDEILINEEGQFQKLIINYRKVQIQTMIE